MASGAKELFWRTDCHLCHNSIPQALSHHYIITQCHLAQLTQNKAQRLLRVNEIIIIIVIVNGNGFCLPYQFQRLDIMLPVSKMWLHVFILYFSAQNALRKRSNKPTIQYVFSVQRRKIYVQNVVKRQKLQKSEYSLQVYISS